jgi:undecaprenyl-diphosphatase
MRSDHPPAVGPRWALARGWLSTWRTARAAWRELPPAAVRAWRTLLAVGFLACAPLAAGLSLWGRARAGDGLQTWDEALLRRVVADDWLSFQAAMWVEALGASSILIPATLVAAVVAARARRPLFALTLLVAFALHEPLVWIGWETWDRPRPQLVAGGIAAPPLHAFPSGHAVQVLAVWGLLCWEWARRSRSVVERGLIALLLVAMLAVVSYARVRLGTHWPSDIAAGTVLGVAWLAVCALALRAGERLGAR